MKSLEQYTRYVKPHDIAFDPENPRGEEEKQIIDDPDFKKLISSIEAHGILEPLIVRKDTSRDNCFVLIDGERRLRAARHLSEIDKNRNLVPILVALDEADGRVLAYQVHMLRKNWNKASETKSIRAILADIKKENPGINDKDILKHLRRITAHTDSEISEFMKLLKYDDRVIDKVITGQIDFSYLIQNEASFINPIKRKYPSLYDKYGEDQLRSILIEKAEKGLLVNTRFLMDKFRAVFAVDIKKDELEKVIDSFLNNPEINIQDTYLKCQGITSGERRKGVKQRNKKHTSSVDQDEVSTYKRIRHTVKEVNSLKKVRDNYESIGKKLSQEEIDYISEGIFCLENNCLKAAVVMIWAAGISKIINYVAKRIPDYNAAARVMQSIKKDPYKHWHNYKLDVASEDDLRDGKDWQLLYYTLYKQIITRTEFNKLKGHYSTRCDCAHPTDLSLSLNEVISIYDNAFKLIFNNQRLS